MFYDCHIVHLAANPLETFPSAFAALETQSSAMCDQEAAPRWYTEAAIQTEAGEGSTRRWTTFLHIRTGEAAGSAIN